MTIKRLISKIPINVGKFQILKRLDKNSITDIFYQKGVQMKRVWIVALLGMVGIAYPYVSSSFRYSSTAGLYLDDYDWLATDPGYIPYIEGNRLYTNLSNFINQRENLFGNLGAGYYLLGLKYSNLGFILDNYCSKLSDSTGIGDFLGHGEKIDTVYERESTTGKPISTSIYKECRDAWHEERATDLMIGFGLSLGEMSSIGFSYSYADSSYTLVSPDINYTTSTEKDSGGSTRSFAFDSSKGTEKSFFDAHRLLFSYWNKGEDWDFNLKLGGVLRMGDLSKTEVDARSRYESEGSLDSSSSFNALHKSPYLGFGIPLDFLAIRHLDESGELWFNIGGMYYQRSWKGDAGGSEINTTTEASLSTTSSLYDTLKGSHSELSGYLFTKGLFSLSERVGLGLGFRFSVGIFKDSSNTHTNVSYTEKTEGSITTTDSSYLNWDKLDRIKFSFSLPVGLEFKIIEPLVIRLGATYLYDIINITESEGFLGPDSVMTLIDSDGDGTVDSTYIAYRGSNPSISKEERKETIPHTLYSFGLGYKVTDNFQIDLMGFSRLLDLTRWRLSLTLKF